MNLLSWNVRGLLSSRRRLSRILHREHVNFLSVIEPFIAPDRLDNFVRDFKFAGGFASLETKIWLFWSDSFEVDIVIDSEQFVFCNVRFVP